MILIKYVCKSLLREHKCESGNINLMKQIFKKHNCWPTNPDIGNFSISRISIDAFFLLQTKWKIVGNSGLIFWTQIHENGGISERGQGEGRNNLFWEAEIDQ